MKLLALFLSAFFFSGAISTGSVHGAVYVQDNNPEGTSVIAVRIGQDGRLSAPVRTPTGGKGLYALQDGSPPATDTTFSSDSVTVSGDKLFVVNTGSATVSYFKIPADDPTHPILVGAPGKVHGDFPNTVAYSPLHNLVCAAATGKNAGVTCFTVTDHGLVVKTPNLPFPIEQTTPPEGPGNTASDIVFNPSQSAFFVTIKVTSGAATILAYRVSAEGTVSDKPVISHPSGLVGAFSMTFLGSDSRAVISDLTYGASIVDISASLAMTEEKKIQIPVETAACWTVYDPAHDSIYVMDAGNDNITVVDPAVGTVRYQLDGPPDANGAYDTKQDRNFLYNLLGVAKIAVYTLAGSPATKPNMIQVIDLSSLGSRQGWEGLALYAES